MTSFSTEWATYRYDGVIWEMNYAHHEERFLRELGVSPYTATGLFLELGCGLGVTTFLAQRNFRTDAVGVDTSAGALPPHAPSSAQVTEHSTSRVAPQKRIDPWL